MVTKTNEENWPVARLIPVTGIGNAKEAETRAASAVLAVLSVVRDLSSAVFTPYGASRAAKATVETFTEPVFKLDGKNIRPDGLVRISYGKNVWICLIEFKTHDGKLEADQINNYWEVARQNNFDAVLTISNELAASPGAHPTEGLRVRSNSKVQVHHLSWTALLSIAVMEMHHRGVDDPEQAWIIGELIRYLEHDESGAMAFSDMGTNWVPVRDAARDGALRKTDPAVQDVALRWEQLLRFTSLQLGSQIGEDVQHVLSRAHTDPRTRTAYLVDQLVKGEPLDGTLRIPHTVGDIDVAADLKARRILAAVDVTAPDDRRGSARCTWIANQLKEAPSNLVIESYPKNARTPHAATLAEVSEDRNVLLGPDRQDPYRFRLVLSAEMGLTRKSSGRKPGFIDSVTDLVERFYGEVVQNVAAFSPKAPKISGPKASPGSEPVWSAPTEPLPTPAPLDVKPGAEPHGSGAAATSHPG